MGAPQRPCSGSLVSPRACPAGAQGGSQKGAQTRAHRISRGLGMALRRAKGRNSTWLGCACPRPVGLTRAWRPSRTKLKIACFACPPQQLRELLRGVDREQAHGHDTAAPGHVDDAMCVILVLAQLMRVQFWGTSLQLPLTAPVPTARTWATSTSAIVSSVSSFAPPASQGILPAYCYFSAHTLGVG